MINRSNLYPMAAAATLPKRLKNILETPNIKELCKRKKLSMAKVEYVVNAPKNPEVINALAFCKKL